MSNREQECLELLEYIKEIMIKYDLRFSQLMYNLELDFVELYNKENKEILKIIKEKIKC
mgnify:CR=1 FL=1